MQEEYESEHFFDEAERVNFMKVICSFKYYRQVIKIFLFHNLNEKNVFRKNSVQRINHRICFVSTLKQKQQSYLEKYSKYLNATKECIEANARVIDKMLANVDNLFINSSTKSNIEPEDPIIQDPDSDKVIRLKKYFKLMLLMLNFRFT